MRHVARKRFGQHFLADEAIVDAIVEAVDPRPGDTLVEIGPGLGALTAPLLARARRLVAIELDRDLAARLRGRAGLELIEGDALAVDYVGLAQRLGAPLRIVGNLPYNISTPILFRLLDAADRVRDQHAMLQREVVERMVAEPASKAYGRLSVMLQWRYEMERLLDVPPSAFDPPPQVDSAVVRMWPRAGIDASLRATLEALVACAFSQRRKLLRHTLGRWLEARQAAVAFDLRRRAEEVPVPEYVALAAALHAAGSATGP
jgi:16S rRNA (adenine1518-N6/adenine1519-N6)-dimethyltransferase